MLVRNNERLQLTQDMLVKVCPWIHELKAPGSLISRRQASMGTSLCLKLAPSLRHSEVPAESG